MDHDSFLGGYYSYTSSESEEEELYRKIVPFNPNKDKTTNHYHNHNGSTEKKPKKSRLSRLREVNWRNAVTVTCLWLAYLLCNMSYSLLGPFFPVEVKLTPD